MDANDDMAVLESVLRAKFASTDLDVKNSDQFTKDEALQRALITGFACLRAPVTAVSNADVVYRINSDCEKSRILLEQYAREQLCLSEPTLDRMKSVAVRVSNFIASRGKLNVVEDDVIEQKEDDAIDPITSQRQNNRARRLRRASIGSASSGSFMDVTKVVLERLDGRTAIKQESACQQSWISGQAPSNPTANGLFILLGTSPPEEPLKFGGSRQVDQSVNRRCSAVAPKAKKIEFSGPIEVPVPSAQQIFTISLWRCKGRKQQACLGVGSYDSKLALPGQVISFETQLYEPNKGTPIKQWSCSCQFVLARDPSALRAARRDSAAAGAIGTEAVPPRSDEEIQMMLLSRIEALAASFLQHRMLNDTMKHVLFTIAKAGGLSCDCVLGAVFSAHSLLFQPCKPVLSSALDSWIQYCNSDPGQESRLPSTFENEFVDSTALETRQLLDQTVSTAQTILVSNCLETLRHITCLPAAFGDEAVEDEEDSESEIFGLCLRIISAIPSSLPVSANDIEMVALESIEASVAKWHNHTASAIRQQLQSSRSSGEPRSSIYDASSFVSSLCRISAENVEKEAAIFIGHSLEEKAIATLVNAHLDAVSNAADMSVCKDSVMLKNSTSSEDQIFDLLDAMLRLGTAARDADPNSSFMALNDVCAILFPSWLNSFEASMNSTIDQAMTADDFTFYLGDHHSESKTVSAIELLINRAIKLDALIIDADLCRSLWEVIERQIDKVSFRSKEEVSEEVAMITSSDAASSGSRKGRSRVLQSLNVIAGKLGNAHTLDGVKTLGVDLIKGTAALGLGAINLATLGLAGKLVHTVAQSVGDGEGREADKEAASEEQQDMLLSSLGCSPSLVCTTAVLHRLRQQIQLIRLVQDAIDQNICEAKTFAESSMEILIRNHDQSMRSVLTIYEGFVRLSFQALMNEVTFEFSPLLQDCQDFFDELHGNEFFQNDVSFADAFFEYCLSTSYDSIRNALLSAYANDDVIQKADVFLSCIQRYLTQKLGYALVDSPKISESQSKFEGVLQMTRLPSSQLISAFSNIKDSSSDDNQEAMVGFTSQEDAAFAIMQVLETRVTHDSTIAEFVTKQKAVMTWRNVLSVPETEQILSQSLCKWAVEGLNNQYAGVLLLTSFHICFLDIDPRRLSHHEHYFALPFAKLSSASKSFDSLSRKRGIDFDGVNKTGSSQFEVSVIVQSIQGCNEEFSVALTTSTANNPDGSLGQGFAKFAQANGKTKNITSQFEPDFFQTGYLHPHAKVWQHNSHTLQLKEKHAFLRVKVLGKSSGLMGECSISLASLKPDTPEQRWIGVPSTTLKLKFRLGLQPDTHKREDKISKFRILPSDKTAQYSILAQVENRAQELGLSIPLKDTKGKPLRLSSRIGPSGRESVFSNSSGIDVASRQSVDYGSDPEDQGDDDPLQQINSMIFGRFRISEGVEKSLRCKLAAPDGKLGMGTVAILPSYMCFLSDAGRQGDQVIMFGKVSVVKKGRHRLVDNAIHITMVTKHRYTIFDMPDRRSVLQALTEHTHAQSGLDFEGEGSLWLGS